MKFSFNWIRELVPGLAETPQELMRLITMKTAECEGLETHGSDTVIEVDNKSLTHRPDLWGHYGMAREVAAITHRRLRDPVNSGKLPTGAAPIGVEIEDLALCPRYSALVFDNVTVGPSPAWLRDRLEAVGLNAISNIVDVTNYVMAELAQPMHAFDHDKLNGGTILVRGSRAGEEIVALNEETYALSPANLVIADAKGPIAIAGVIGGLHSGIGAGTRRIVLESACFQAASVRKTSVALKLRTDASMRFEKSQDPHNTVRGLARAIELFEQVSPGIRLAGGLADRKAQFKPATSVELSIEWLSRKLGRELSGDEVRTILESLEFGVGEAEPDHFFVTVPSWRATKDISIKDDLLEEVGRMVGYDSITPRAPLVECVVPPENPARLYLRRVRNMAAAQGFTEVYNYSFISDEMARAFAFDPATHVRVANPIASDQTLLRQSLLPRIGQNILENSRRLNAFQLFEIGREIHARAEGLPEEIPHFAAAMYRREDDGGGLLFGLKRLAECLMPGCTVTPAKARRFEHPERAAHVTWRGETVGRLFELHPSFGLEGRASILDVDLAAAQRLDTQATRYKPLRRFPTSAFDLSVVTSLREPAGDVQKRLADAAAGDLVEIEFVRQHIGPPLPEDRKSMSYRLTVGANDRTLSSDEVAQVRSRAIEALRAQGYELRV